MSAAKAKIDAYIPNLCKHAKIIPNLRSYEQFIDVNKNK